jgi:DNA/RNA endonuclease G (NUC1)
MSDIRKYFPSLLLTLLLTYAVVAIQATAYAQSCSCEVSDRKERAYDEMLKLDANEKAEVENLHLPFGIPQSSTNATNEHLLHQDEYIIMYDDDLRVPLWVGYQLRRGDLLLERDRHGVFPSRHKTE